jgi:hypothetical protein
VLGERNILVVDSDTKVKRDFAQIFISCPLQKEQEKEDPTLQETISERYAHEAKRQDKRTHCKSPIYNASYMPMPMPPFIIWLPIPIGPLKLLIAWPAVGIAEGFCT